MKIIVGVMELVGCMLIMWLMEESMWNLFNGVKENIMK